MIIEKDTERYKVNPKKLIEKTFTSAYDSNNDAPVVYKPDAGVTVLSIISLILIVGMCVLTWYTVKTEAKEVSEGKSAVIWLVIGAVFIFFIVTTIMKYMKQLKAYKKLLKKKGFKGKVKA